MDLEFEITAFPSWRTGADNSSDIPSTDTMLIDILKYVEQWQSIKQKGEVSKYRKKMKRLRVKYIVHTQIEEGIGVQNEDQTSDIIDEIENELQRMKIKRKTDNDEDNIVKRKKVIIESKDIPSGSESHSLNEKERLVNPVASHSQKLSQLKDIMQSQSTQEMIEDEISNESNYKRLETINLYKALLHLETIIEKEYCKSQEERKELEQLLEIKNCIQETHRVLMNDIASIKKTGIFSTCVRMASFQGETSYYPCFSTELLAETALQCITDEYHFQLEKLKKEKDKKLTKNVLTKIFRLVSVFTFSFLQLHPFADGNGRLARLLCSYMLGIFTPFPSPVYNVYSTTCRFDFVKTLRTAMKGIEDISFENPLMVTSESQAVQMASKCLEVRPSDLCALIIESNWYMWKDLLEN